MKTSCEIKQIVKNCLSYRDQPGIPCNRCPYQNEYYFCKAEMAHDIIECIDGLEERIRLMMTQMEGDCGCCKHFGPVVFKSETEPLTKDCLPAVCQECMDDDERPNWEYEGLPGDE